MLSTFGYEQWPWLARPLNSKMSTVIWTCPWSVCADKCNSHMHVLTHLKTLGFVQIIRISISILLKLWRYNSIRCQSTLRLDGNVSSHHIPCNQSCWTKILQRTTTGLSRPSRSLRLVAFNSNPTDSQVATRYAGRRGPALLAMLCAMLVGYEWVLSTSATPRHKTRKYVHYLKLLRCT